MALPMIGTMQVVVQQVRPFSIHGDVYLELLETAVVALGGGVVPGAGYWVLGGRGRAMMVGVPVVVLFLLGCLLGSVRVVEAPSGGGTIMASVASRPWFVPQVLNGPIALAAAWES